jgi:hypothetical protein
LPVMPCGKISFAAPTVDAGNAARHVGRDHRPVLLRVGRVEPARSEHRAHDPLVGVLLDERVEAAPAPRPPDGARATDMPPRGAA